MIYRYNWRNNGDGTPNPKRLEMYGRLCKIIARPGKGAPFHTTRLIEFLDNGQRATVNVRALRREPKTCQAE